MNLGELKPLLTALVLPPAGPLLVAGLAYWSWLRRSEAPRRAAQSAVHTSSRIRPKAAPILLVLSLLFLWLASCHGFGMRLERALLPQPIPTSPQVLKTTGIQAIVVLGGGVLPHAPEYGSPQPTASTLLRIRYGAYLARHTQLPLAFAGGIGWAASGTKTAPEGEVAAAMLASDYGTRFSWLDSTSRDTAENARAMRGLLGTNGIVRIALVTDARHMPRAIRHFHAAGFTVTPAPTQLTTAAQRTLLQWLPSAEGLMLSRQVMREWLGAHLGH